MKHAGDEKNRYNKTIVACFVGYIVQAIVNNLVPLLFLTFQNTYQIPLSKITLLITINFILQLTVDLAAIAVIDRIGYRASAILAHLFAAVGLAGLAFLPEVCSDPYIGIVIAVVVYAVGGGLLEVIVSPIVEACPTDNKETAMSLLHSFYCWGQVAVVLLSTIYFQVAGIENWKYLTLLWAVIPVVNGIVFCYVPIAPLVAEEEEELSVIELFQNKKFWLFMLFMVCAGASELGVSQWASTFAERGLSLSKAVGDLAGPMLFAVLMGSARAFYGKFGEKIDLHKFMYYSSLLCIVSYLVIALASNPVVSLVACGICGLSVGIMWPGTFSTASAGIPRGGTAMFALLALAGDLGCSSGPSVIGFVSSHFGDNLHKGILVGTIFPLLLLLGLIVKNRKSKNITQNQQK